MLDIRGWLNSFTGKPGWYWKAMLFIGIVAVQYTCFYWWAAADYYFTGDSLFYFHAV